MDEKGIEVFLAIAMTKSFLKAASILNLTQSTVSHRLKELESSLGNTLIIRHRGRKEVMLTSFGEQFLPLALRWRQLGEEIDHIRHTLSSRTIFSVGGLDSVKDFILLPFLATFRRHYPQIQLNLSTGSSTCMYELVSHREIDMAFVQLDLQNTMVKTEPFCQEELIVLYRKKSYLSINSQTLSPENELMINWGMAFIHWHDTIWGVDHKPGTICDTLYEMRGLMTQPADWAFIPGSSAGWFLKDPDWAVSRFPIPPPNRIILQITPKHPKVSTFTACHSFSRILKSTHIRKSFDPIVKFSSSLMLKSIQP